MKIPADWTFDNAEVAGEFDTHVKEQLPWYDLATKAVGLIGRHFIPQGGRVYDLGASTGNIGREFSSTLRARNAELIAIESAKEMALRYDGPGRLLCADAEEVIFKPFDLGIAFLFFMFIPLKERRPLLERLMLNLRPGGALIVLDKVHCEGETGLIMHRLTMQSKRLSHVSDSEILDKELSLAGVQRPIEPQELFCNFQRSEWFRFGEFAGWILLK